MANSPVPGTVSRPRPSSIKIVWRAFGRLLQSLTHPNVFQLEPGHKVLLLGSAPVERIELAYQDLLKEFTPSDIAVLVYSADDLELFGSRLPGAEVQAVVHPGAMYSLTGELDRLYRVSYPLAAMVLGGEGRFNRIRIIGLLGGSRLIRIYDENIEWFYFNIASLDRVWEGLFIAALLNFLRYLARPLKWLGSWLGVAVMLLRNLPRFRRGS